MFCKHFLNRENYKKRKKDKVGRNKLPNNGINNYNNDDS